jgi:hypothetical protein
LRYLNLQQKMMQDMPMKELTQIIGEYDGKIGYDDQGLTFVAMAGTGFDPDNVQHRQGSDALRYAIWIQQARDAKDWAKADQLRAMVSAFGYDVKNNKDGTYVRLELLRGMHYFPRVT